MLALNKLWDNTTSSERNKVTTNDFRSFKIVLFEPFQMRENTFRDFVVSLPPWSHLFRVWPRITQVFRMFDMIEKFGGPDSHNVWRSACWTLASVDLETVRPEINIFEVNFLR